MKRQNYMSLAGITDEALAVVNTVLDQVDELFAQTSLKLSAGDQEKLIEINDYIKDLYQQKQSGKVSCIRQQLKCWYEQRQFLLQTVMSGRDRRLFREFNRQLRQVLDLVNHNRANEKINKLFNHLDKELGSKSAYTTSLSSSPLKLTINLAS
ncbi:hypothetical protein SG34_015075 [Thalassomonas viridans]|uniref:Uncharacterized protein n=1 Tax=Thalassomonas viridans TaxID=137584 RepID=A0AAE9YY97_9GAMM|nr:hypothetical protein [Thalassomonas viridans]WDE02767.1 hypothetical protein SG34_015075 [Thalassomonas viridans]